MRRSTWTRIAVVLFATAALYTLAGYLLAPRLIEREIVVAISERTGHRVEIQKIAVNPFKLSVELSDLSIDGPGSTTLVSIPRVVARVRIASLLAPGWSFRNLVVDAPRLSLPAGNNGRNDFAALTAALSPTIGGDSRLPIVNIGQLSITRGELQLTGVGTDAGIEGAPLEFTAISLSIDNLSTRHGQRGQFDLAVTVNQSARIATTGEFVPFPAELNATADVSDLNVAEIRPAIRLGTELDLESALMAGELTVHYAEGRATILGNIDLQQVAMVEHSTRAPVFAAVEVLATQVAIETSPLQVSIEDLRLKKPRLQLARDANGAWHGVDWLRALVNEPIRSQRIDIEEGRLDFTDFRLSEAIQFDANHINGNIIQPDTGAETNTTLSLQGTLMSGAAAKLSASWLTADPDLSGNVNLTVDNLDAVQLSPYLSALAGREVAAGKLHLELEYRAHDRRFDIDNKISAAGFKLGAPGENINAIELPLDLAVALLTDNNGQISISIPVSTGRIDNEFQTEAVLGDAFSDFVSAIADSPFAVLGELAGWSGPDLGHIAFDSGSAALTASSSGQLAVLATALEQRPALGLRVNGRYDRVADRNVLARQQMRLHVALASSTGPPGRAALTPLEFTDPKVISILNEFAATRLSSENLTTIRERYPEQAVAYYDAVFEALVANEAVSATALNSLARFRAQSIVNELIAAGIDSDRLQVNTKIESVEERGQTGLVTLDVTL